MFLNRQHIEIGFGATNVGMKQVLAYGDFKVLLRSKSKKREREEGEKQKQKVRAK